MIIGGKRFQKGGIGKNALFFSKMVNQTPSFIEVYWFTVACLFHWFINETTHNKKALSFLPRAKRN